MKKTIYLTLISMLILSCGKNDNDNGFITYIASEKPITRTFFDYQIDCSEDKAYSFYEDFDNQYNFLLINGNINILPRVRYKGFWDCVDQASIYSLCAMRSVGEVKALSDITEQCKRGEGKDYVYLQNPFFIHTNGSSKIGVCSSMVKPNYGYTGCFFANGVWHDIQLRIIDYSTDKGGGLKSIKVEYQLVEYPFDE